MVSGLDLAAVELPRHRPDAGGLVAMLSGAIKQLDGVPFLTPPPIVTLARCFRGFGAIGLASYVLHEQCVPRPDECLPVAQECESIGSKLVGVIGEDLRAKHTLGRAAITERLSDPMLEWIGPDLAGCVQQMLRLSAAMRIVLGHIAEDETALPLARGVAAQGAQSATFVHWQYFV